MPEFWETKKSDQNGYFRVLEVHLPKWWRVARRCITE